MTDTTIKWRHASTAPLFRAVLVRNAYGYSVAAKDDANDWIVMSESNAIWTNSKDGYGLARLDQPPEVWAALPEL